MGHLGRLHSPDCVGQLGMNRSRLAAVQAVACLVLSESVRLGPRAIRSSHWHSLAGELVLSAISAAAGRAPAALARLSRPDESGCRPSLIHFDQPGQPGQAHW
jgi:hypothetical protein